MHGPDRSALSDLTPDPGPGAILTLRARDSLRRCYRAAFMLFRSRRAEFSSFEWREVRKHLRADVLSDIVRWYWHRHDRDRRTKGSDLKRELTKVVTHLGPVTVAMSKIRPESKRILNRLLRPPTSEQPTQQDVIAQIEHLNGLLLQLCKPLIRPRYIKGASTSGENACEALMALWEHIAGRAFERTYEIVPSRPGNRLIRDRSEFVNGDMRFVHAMLQAIDPKVTYSQVRSNVRRVAARAPKTR